MAVHIKKQTEPRLYINLNFFIMVGLSFIVFLGPFMKGLFFEVEWLFTQILIGGLVVLHWLDRAITGNTRVALTYFDILNWVLVALYFLAIITAANTHGAYTTAFRYLSYYLVFYLTYESIKSIKAKSILLNIMYFTGVLVSIVGIMAALQFIDFPGAYTGKRMHSVFQYANTFAAFSGALFFLGLSLWNQRQGLLGKLYFGIGQYLLAVTIIASQSRGVWVLLPIAAILYFILQYLLKDKFLTSLYNILMILTATVIGSRSFLSNLYSNNHHAAFKWLIIGAMVLGAIQLLLHYGEKAIQKINIDPRYKKIVPAGLLVYLLIIGFIYLNYMGSVLPSLSEHLMATEVTQRVQTIDNTSSSFTSRMDMNKWALQIMLDKPLLGAGGKGWEALHHQYQDYLFWSTEVHNNFLQIGVETGFLGLLTYLGIWSLVIYTAYKGFRKVKSEGNGSVYVGILTAIFLLIAHSAIDFDFSYGIIPIYTMALIGIMFSPKMPNKISWKSINLTWQKCLISGLISVILFCIPPILEYRATLYGARGAYAMENIQYDEAIYYYERAKKLSPFNQNFTADLAQLYGAQFAILQNNEAKIKAEGYIAKTLDLAPYNLKISQALAQTYNLLGNEDGVIREKIRVAQILPLDPQANLALATTYFNLGVEHMNQGSMSQAQQYIAKADGLLALFTDSGRGMDQKKYRPLPSQYLLKGQIDFLQGEGDSAKVSFSQAAKNRDIRESAHAWLAALYLAQDDGVEAAKITKQIQNKAMAQQIPGIAELYGVITH